MSKNPRRFNRPAQIIVSVEQEIIEAIDKLMCQGRHHSHRNLAEFVRLGIERS